MKINLELKNNYPSVEFCYNNKCVIIRYWGGLKFDKVVIKGEENIDQYGCYENPNLSEQYYQETYENES